MTYGWSSFEEIVEELLKPIDETPSPWEKLLLVDPVDKARRMNHREVDTGRYCSTDEYNKLIRIYGAHGRVDDAFRVLMVSRSISYTPPSLPIASC